MEQNHNMLRGISENGGIVFYGVDSTEIVRDMERLHKTSAVTTAALGRLLTAASMMGIMLKNTQDSVTLQIKGGGPAGRLLAVSDGTGNVKSCPRGRTAIWMWALLSARTGPLMLSSTSVCASLISGRYR